jgi:hypothetical protein
MHTYATNIYIGTYIHTESTEARAKSDQVAVNSCSFKNKIEESD